ncbi:MAG TPA: polysaccharide deacetylase family protein [Acidobacteriaceae bacterium]|nr:polysaccharide deacetylase family protein [Acidobacteriaceae bacterium]
MRLKRWGWWLALGILVCGLARAQQIAITVDDLPVSGKLPHGESRTEIAHQMIRALHAAHVPPTYGFVNGQRIQDQPSTIAVLGAWRAAGNLLGNHTWSHSNYDQETLPEFEQDIEKNEPSIRLQMDNQDWHWFRFPYLTEGDNVAKLMGIRAFLAQHGYKIAGVTLNFDDYAWNDPYARCVTKGDTRAIGWLEASYMDAARDDLRVDRSMAHQLYGRDLRYVLLLHIGAFDARMLPRLLRFYRQQGFIFITLQQAEQDPFYRYDVDPRLLPGPDSLKAAMAAKKLPLPKRVDFLPRLNALCR